MYWSMLQSKGRDIPKSRDSRRSRSPKTYNIKEKGFTTPYNSQVAAGHCNARARFWIESAHYTIVVCLIKLIKCFSLSLTHFISLKHMSQPMATVSYQTTIPLWLQDSFIIIFLKQSSPLFYFRIWACRVTTNYPKVLSSSSCHQQSNEG